MLTDPEAGVLDLDLREAALQALVLRRESARAHALRYSWENSARQFIENMMLAHNLGCCRSGARADGPATRQKKTARLGGTGPFHSHASVWGTLGGNRVRLDLVSDPLNDQKAAKKSAPRAVKPQNLFCEKNFNAKGGLRDF